MLQFSIRRCLHIFFDFRRWLRHNTSIIILFFFAILLKQSCWFQSSIVVVVLVLVLVCWRSRWNTHGRGMLRRVVDWIWIRIVHRRIRRMLGWIILIWRRGITRRVPSIIRRIYWSCWIPLLHRLSVKNLSNNLIIRCYYFIFIFIYFIIYLFIYFCW